MPKRINLEGKRFNHLVVQSYSHTNGQAHWVCLCDCGGLTVVSRGNLTSGSVKACGCLAPKVADLLGFSVGKLVVESYVETARGKSWWRVRCECGNSKVMASSEITRAHVETSCGCALQNLKRKLATVHGGSKTPEHSSWMSMLSRCKNPNATGWPMWGGRGISVCARWKKFENFLEDMGRRPTGTTLDRRDNNKGYSKGNCRWATPKQQALNRRSTVLVRYRGKQIPLVEYASLKGLTRYHAHKLATLEGRLVPKIKEPNMKPKTEVHE